jgi:hypothetical protein
VAHHLGAPLTVAFGGLVCIAAAIWFGRHLPSVRAEARELILAQGLSAGSPAQEITTRGLS